MEQKTKEQLLKELVSRFHELVGYNFQPKGFGFVETPDDSEEIKKKLIIKEGEEHPKTLKEEFIELAQKHGLKEPESIYETWNFEKKKGDKKDDDSEEDKKKDSKKKVVKKKDDDKKE